jgi:hypothetical protein
VLLDEAGEEESAFVQRREEEAEKTKDLTHHILCVTSDTAGNHRKTTERPATVLDGIEI